ncbi:MAG TPA: hypothetical protein VF546_16660 [Pyrinomonadaceae bacterium]|jgi:hypothetical protein
MASKEEIIKAKDVLSARLLSLGLRSGVMAMRYKTRMREAVADVGANVHAVGVGRKIVNGEPTDELAVRIYVVQKLATSAIPPRDLLPAALDGIPCDVIESPPAFILQPRKKTPVRTAPAAVQAAANAPVTVAAGNCSDNRRLRQRPFGAGVSVAHRDVTAGTIGYFCRSTAAGDDPDDIFILSNNHVLANVNAGTPGDEILQPGPADGGVSADHVANLHRFKRVRLGGDVPNLVDAAIARLLPNSEHQASICRIGAVTGTARGTEDMRVRKHGRTSGLTDGVITDESVNQLVGMDHSDPSVVALFRDQMRVERAGASVVFGLGGDSGSLVVNAENRRAVGLYFAGPDNGIYGLANHIGDVLDQLQIELII